jgi:ribosome-associated toxin RatA of RatAB toxin-antitoxin module
MPAKLRLTWLAAFFSIGLPNLACLAAETASPPPPASYKYDAPRASLEADGKLKASIEAVVPIDCQRAFDVFTDYEGMTRFLPGMEMSKVQSRSGNKVVLSQRGTVSYGIFVKQYTSTRELTIDAPRRIDSASLPTDELPISSTATFREIQGRCAIGYTTHIGIPSWTPSFAAIGFAKSIAATQMTALLAEMKKRNPAPQIAKNQTAPHEPASMKEPAPERIDTESNQPPAISANAPEQGVVPAPAPAPAPAPLDAPRESQASQP